jgi:hypothetical protein
MISRSEALARKLARIRRGSIALVIALGLSIFGVLAALIATPILEEREEFNLAREDFVTTWCATYGTDPTNPATEEWTDYVSRHDSLFSRNMDVLGMTTGTSLDGQKNIENVILWAISDRIYQWSLSDYWFGGWFNAYFDFFDFGGGWDQPPSC